MQVTLTFPSVPEERGSVGELTGPGMAGGFILYSDTPILMDFPVSFVRV